MLQHLDLSMFLMFPLTHMHEHGEAGGRRQLHWHTMGFARTPWQFRGAIKRLQTFINSFAAAAALPEKPCFLWDALTSCLFPSRALEIEKSGLDWVSVQSHHTADQINPLLRWGDKGGLGCGKETREGMQSKKTFFCRLFLGLSFLLCAAFSFLHCSSFSIPSLLPWDRVTFCSVHWHWFRWGPTVPFWYCITKSMKDGHKNSIGEHLLKILQNYLIS